MEHFNDCECSSDASNKHSQEVIRARVAEHILKLGEGRGAESESVSSHKLGETGVGDNKI